MNVHWECSEYESPTCRNCDKPTDSGGYCSQTCEGMDRFPPPRDDYHTSTSGGQPTMSITIPILEATRINIDLEWVYHVIKMMEEKGVPLPVGEYSTICEIISNARRALA